MREVVYGVSSTMHGMCIVDTLELSGIRADLDVGVAGYPAAVRVPLPSGSAWSRRRVAFVAEALDPRACVVVPPRHARSSVRAAAPRRAASPERTAN